MKPSPIVWLALLLLLGGCGGNRHAAASEESLDGLLGYADPVTCEPNATFDKLTHSMLRDTISKPVVYGPIEAPLRYKAAIGTLTLHRKGDLYEVSAPLRGRWLGVPVRQLTVGGYAGGDGTGPHLTFRAAAFEVRTALAQAGFKLAQAKGDDQLTFFTADGPVHVACQP